MKSVLIYTVHKAASTFLHELTNGLAREMKITFFSINDDQFHHQIKNGSWKSFIEDQSEVGLFGPIRSGEATPQFPANLDLFSIVLHLRDPRDMLTSMYFSHAYSHRVKSGRFDPSDEARQLWRDQGIDQFVLNAAPGIRKSFDVFCDRLLDRPNVVFVRYEEMVTNYRGWLAKYMQAFRHLPMPSQKAKERLFPFLRFRKIRRTLYEKHCGDFSVSEENVYQHKRRIIPGDHRQKLSAETIHQLNDEFGSLLDRLGYQR